MDKHSQRPLQVVLCWHMHQPDYFDPARGIHRQPWTYLHAIKDYVDMAAHLEAHPSMQAVVNFSAVLIEQIETYREELAAAAAGGRPLRDPLLAALHKPGAPGTVDDRRRLIEACLRGMENRLFDGLDAFRALAATATDLLRHPDSHLSYLDDQFFVDLVVGYHLGWLGQSVRQTDARVAPLYERAAGYSLRDCRDLLAVIRELLDGILARYRRLAGRGQIELSVTPFSHPILPLLLDLGAAREAWPDCPLPRIEAYPGGEARARWQLQRAREVFERVFGRAPAGCWPAEGGVSAQTLDLGAQTGFAWLASGQAVLRHSLTDPTPPAAQLYQPYRLASDGPACFFRDDALADAIGFVYRDWHADDAVADLVARLDAIATQQPGDGAPWLVPIILDGENAWEYYPDNGRHFLDGLYTALCAHPSLRPTTFSAYLAQADASPLPLARLVAGSWVYGTFSTWIGDAEKNCAWELLAEAKNAYDSHAGALPAAARTAADRQLAVCEASDWFWWFGPHNGTATVADFDRLFRQQLTALYRVLDCPPPKNLSRPFAHGSAQGAAPTMRAAQ